MIKPLTPFLFLLFSFFFLTSCSGQVKTNVRQDSVAESNPTANKAYVDPFFFIKGQLCQHVRNIFQDKRGHLWFGTNVYGLMRYNGDTLEYFTKADGFAAGRITGIVEDAEGNVWFGAYGGLTKYDPSAELRPGGKIFTNFTEKDGLLNNEIWSLMIDRKGIFWIGTNEGVSQFDGKTFTTFPIPKAQVKDTTTTYGYDRITSIIEDKNGVLWFGTDGFGITQYDPSAELKPGGKTFTHLTKEDGLPDNNVGGFMEDSKGNIWMGTSFGGVSMYDPSATLRPGGKRFNNFTQDGVISGVEVGGFYEDKRGNIWFAAENHGVYRYDPSASLTAGGKAFTNLYKDEGLITNGILSIFEDKEGRFWFGGWGGLFRYDGQSFVPVTKDGPWH